MDPGGRCQIKLLVSGPKVGARGELRGLHRYLLLYVLFHLVLFTHASATKACDKSCPSGKCVNGSCVCDQGWVGDQCQHCQGRFK